MSLNRSDNLFQKKKIRPEIAHSLSDLGQWGCTSLCLLDPVLLQPQSVQTPVLCNLRWLTALGGLLAPSPLCSGVPHKFDLSL